MSNYATSMALVRRERETEAKIRAMDASDIVELVHELEDEIERHEVASDLLRRDYAELEARISEMGWRPIETAPEAKDGLKMFIIKCFNVSHQATSFRDYTSDPWCVWRMEDGWFSRWPYAFPPTHWMPLPEAPQ